MTTITKEPQNQSQIEDFYRMGPATLGPWTTHIWRHDPRHLCFLLARYKFVAKMLEGKESALEVGCGDAFGVPVVLQTVSRVHGIDFEPLVLKEVTSRFRHEGIKNATFSEHNIVSGAPKGIFDSVYSLDVIEHIPEAEENRVIDNICSSLVSHGVCILGTPNITADQYASEKSKEGHINLKSAKTLRQLLSRRFYNVFSFSMNDEVIHTGYSPMAHYLFAMGVGVKSSG